MKFEKRARVLCTLTVSSLIVSASSCSSPVETPPGGESGSATGGTSGTSGTGGAATGGTAPTGGTATGGTAPTGGTTTGGSATGGTSGTAGTGTGGSGQGGMSGGGQGGDGMAGGGMSTGGAQAGAGMGGIAGSGPGGASGAAGGGRGGSAGKGGSAGSGGSGGKAPADGSPGCGKSGPQTGSSGSPLTVSGHQYYVKLPTNYNASTPYPVLFMFNPTNNPISWAETSAGFESNGAKDAWIRVYPHPANSSSGWGSGDVSFFAPLYTAITNAFCVDRERAFAAGESSGGDFSSILGCEHADKLRAVGPCATKPVNNYPLDASRRNCTGQVASVVIHGKNDNVVTPANGPLTRDFYVALNHCTSMSMPVTGYTEPMSNCIEYQGCDAGFPVYWCQHTDPEYGGTNHGWPRFAAKFLFEKWSQY